MSELYLGVDGGNSKTVALIADASGAVRGRGRAGNGDIYGGASAEEAVLNVVSAVAAALLSAGSTIGDVRHGALCLAGVDWSEDADYWQRELPSRLPGLRSWSVKNDGYALLRCGDLSGIGVALTAGTGPAVAARGPDGREFCASWWIQELLGGRGLGYSAFSAVFSADHGIALPTGLTERLLRLYGCTSVEELLYEFTRRTGQRPEREKWRAARAVLQASEAGDAVAQEIVRSQARSFARHARVAAERVGFEARRDAVGVVLGGSILDSEHPAFRDAVTEELLAELPGAVVRSSVGSPLAGALLDALAEAGVTVDAGVRDRVVQAPHPEDFLLTD